MADELSFTIDGRNELRAALARKREAMHPALERAINDSMEEVHLNIAFNLILKTHPPKTLTPSIAPEPPAEITGNLRRSLEEYGPYWTGENSAEGAVGPTAVYARIQELGGIVQNAFGRADVVNKIPARPYVFPAVEKSRAAVAQIFHDAFSEALRS